MKVAIVGPQDDKGAIEAALIAKGMEDEVILIDHDEPNKEEIIEEMQSIWKMKNDPYILHAPLRYERYYKPHKGTPVSVRTEPKIGRNQPCPCGSGRKFKKCCIKQIERNQEI
jgi:uncharacterized protein YecA (UPF0149 family)